MSYRLMTSAGLGALLMAAFAPAAATADPLAEPPVFASKGGTLDLVMVAGAVPTVITDSVTTNAWVYDVCPRMAPDQNTCKNGSHPLGGVRLQLNPGDTLKIRLVNNLPPITDAEHLADNPALGANPTNLHTHGLIVEPHRAEGPNDPYGDYVFLELRNPKNGSCTPTSHTGHGMGHPDMDVACGAVDYAIQIPANHPSGHFWFHPHFHGIALNQVTSGMSGIITIGTPEDMCANAACVAQVRAGNIRHLTLKDTQVLKNGIINTQLEPIFCGDFSITPPPTVPPQGFCAGVNGDAGDFTGGSWFNTVNGQVFPSINVGPAGDIWRILNSSGSRSYDLFIADDTTNTPVLMQVLAIDGVAIDSLALNAQGQDAMAKLLGGKAKPVPCPGPASGPAGLCTTELRLMPSSRAEVRVVGQKSTSATLRTGLYSTGGDNWPAISLAKVTFAPGGGGVLPPLALGMEAGNAMSGTGGLMGPAQLRPRGSFALTDIAGARAAASQAVTGSANPGNLTQATSIAIDPDLKLGLRSSPDCVPLAAGHHRRIYFGDPTPGVDGFGLGYAEIDEKGREIAATRKPVTSFDPTTTTVCVPLGAQGQAVKETWELINLTSEDHNFHIHQTRFRLLQGGTFPGTTLPTRTADGLVLHDNVPLPRAANTDACDGSIDAFMSGACRPTTVVVEIPFHEIGDFVFHCHILEHEDGGMMARIRVVAPPRS
jgi:L-ascorbate oxidase